MIIKQVLWDQDRYIPRSLLEKYPEDLKWALWIRKPEWSKFNYTDIKRMSKLFPNFTDIFPNVDALIIKKRDMVDEIIRWKLNIHNISNLSKEVKQKVLAIFPKKELENTSKRDNSTFFTWYIEKYRASEIKIFFLRKVETFTLTLNDVHRISHYTKITVEEIVRKYNRLVTKKWKPERKIFLLKNNI